MKDIIFIVESAIHCNDGYKTRIEMQLEILALKYRCYILVPIGNEKIKLVLDKNVTIIPYKSYNAKIPFIMNNKKLKKTLSNFLFNHNDSLVIGEAHTSAVMAYKIAKKFNCKFIFDCHGTAPDEVYLYHHNIFGYLYSKWLRFKERDLLRKSDLVITVTKKQYNLWGIDRPHILLPMLPTVMFFTECNHKNEVRCELNINDDSLVYLYSGQDQPWQQVENTISQYKKYESKETVLVIYTKDIIAIEKKILQQNVKNYRIKSIPYHLMPRYLDVADFGFCIRSNSIINLVASPTKVLEYLSRGIKPILSEYVGDFSNDLPQLGLASRIDQNVDKEINVKLDFRKYVKELVEQHVNEYLSKIERL